MAELADAQDSGSCGGNSVQVQVLLPAPRRSKANFAPLFFVRKISAYKLLTYLYRFAKDYILFIVTLP